MRKESQTRKGMLVSKLQKLECSVVAAISSQKNDASAREACLTKVVEELISQGVIRIEIERDESFEKRDKALIKNVLDAQKPSFDVSYRHLSSSEEPLLWAPDIAAWAIQTGTSINRLAITQLFAD